MRYNKKELIKEFNKGKKLKWVFFWGHQKSKTITASCLSQWYGSPFKKDNITYATAEHWMMAEKARLFKDENMLREIIKAKSPTEAKQLGRQVKGFKNNIWLTHRYEIVKQGNLLKFTQNLPLKNFLLNTKSKILVEASPIDSIWGIGLAADDDRAKNPLQWKGDNLLGFALMEVRDGLR